MIINPYVFTVIDPDATAYIAATGITDATQKSAINSLFLNLKSYSLYAKIYAGWPLCWNDATKNTYDLKLIKNLTFFGGLTHANGYVQGNGSTGYGNTGIIPSIEGWGQNNLGASFKSYSSSVTGDGLVFGVVFANSYAARLAADGDLLAFVNDNSISSFNTNSPAAQYSFSRLDSAGVSGYQAGSFVSKSSIASTGLPNTVAITLWSYNATDSSDLKLNTIFFHQGFNATETANFNTCISTFLTAIGA